MKYYKYADEYSEIAPGMVYLETNDGCAIRQITFNGKEYLSSNRKYPNGSMGLAEGQTDFDIIEEIIPISKQEFDEIWNTHLAIHQNEWNATKEAYSIGKEVKGVIEIFFPQGVIVDLGGDALGVADYAESRASTTWENMYPWHHITAIVEGYDEVNQWVILGSPQVHKERTPRY